MGRQLTQVWLEGPFGGNGSSQILVDYRGSQVERVKGIERMGRDGDVEVITVRSAGLNWDGVGETGEQALEGAVSLQIADLDVEHLVAIVADLAGRQLGFGERHGSSQRGGGKNEVQLHGDGVECLSRSCTSKAGG